MGPSAVVGGEAFRMGVREGRKAMSGGALLSMVQPERKDEVISVLHSADVERVAALLHEMAGPFNYRHLATDVDSPVVARSDRTSATLLMTLIADTLRPGVGHIEAVGLLEESICTWIDSGRPVVSDASPCQDLYSIKASELIASSLNVEEASSQAVAARLLCVARFAPSIGVLRTVLSCPV